MAMSEKEIAVWQQQGNRSVRATPTDTAGDAASVTGCLAASVLPGTDAADPEPRDLVVPGRDAVAELSSDERRNGSQ